ncbi:hypothetical protein AAC387_Pa04g1496 [Persea americana]
MIGEDEIRDSWAVTDQIGVDLIDGSLVTGEGAWDRFELQMPQMISVTTRRRSSASPQAKPILSLLHEMEAFICGGKGLSADSGRGRNRTSFAIVIAKKQQTEKSTFTPNSSNKIKTSGDRH